MAIGRLRWFLVFAPALILILVLSVWAAWPVIFGETIILATAPVDPPDPLRGDYVELNLAINRVPNARGFAAGDDIYVLLTEGDEVEAGSGDPFWTIVAKSRSEPERRDGQVCLKGTVDRMEGTTASVRYGIESYFVEKSEDFQEWRGKTVSVEVKVQGCTGRVAAIHLDGVPWNG